MKKNLFTMMAISLFVCILSSLAFGAEEDTEYASGTVFKTSAGQITLNQENDEGETIQVMYQIDKNTKFVNASTWKDLKVGQNVEIEFVIKNKKNIAVSITVEVEEENWGEDESEE
ncbi:MAG: hypothetical protein JW827_00870 [Spirochaetes bacterium]|nr:hypothetical protein [Spirochaetota bacterium]